MSKIKKYIVDPETLIVEIQEERKHRGRKVLGVVLGGAALFFAYLWFYVSVLGLDLPKTAILKRRNADWTTRIERMSAQLDQYDEVLGLLSVRDDRIYRSVYGMDEIPQEVRGAGFGGVDRYAWLEGGPLKAIALRLDVMEKKAYVQSKSFDDVVAMARTAGDRASCIPAIPPMDTDPSTYRLSSPFGYRSDPITGFGKLHTGMDFACPPGNPVFVTGDGTVVKVAHDFYGYGNHVEIEHGYGYRTRYAHLSRIDVYEGQKVSRGDCLGLSGKSGRITGPHLHYEVMYRKDYVNPANFMDLDISAEDYAGMVRKPVRR
ncbi:MAG: M23 family metallopeptidase [Bacteroidales bacterium]|nr:M23 family metallopeptidase [Bacteroidales bacterium]MBR1706501.1 M23 family metallopeptidase [Bacteroidales bacterium]